MSFLIEHSKVEFVAEFLAQKLFTVSKISNAQNSLMEQVAEIEKFRRGETRVLVASDAFCHRVDKTCVC